MNRKLIIRILGAILLIEAVAMLPSLLISFIYGDGDWRAMALSILITAPIGLIMLILPNTGTNAHLRLKEGFVIVALGWLTMSVCGALCGAHGVPFSLVVGAIDAPVP